MKKSSSDSFDHEKENSKENGNVQWEGSSYRMSNVSPTRERNSNLRWESTSHGSSNSVTIKRQDSHTKQKQKTRNVGAVITWSFVVLALICIVGVIVVAVFFRSKPSDDAQLETIEVSLSATASPSLLSSQSPLETITDSPSPALSLPPLETVTDSPFPSSTLPPLGTITDSPLPTLQPQLIINGTILVTPDYVRLCPFTVEVKGASAYYVRLCYLYPPFRSGTDSRSPIRSYNSSGLPSLTYQPDIAFYVAPNSTVDVYVPIGVYEMYYCAGKTWYGIEDDLYGYFGNGKNGEQWFHADDVFDFYTSSDDQYITYHGHTVELYRQQDGNLETSKIDPAALPF